MKSTKILLVGDDSHEMYVKAFYHGFLELGYKNTELFAINHYLEVKSRIGKVIIKAENKFAVGKRIDYINQKLIHYIENMHPDFVFLYSTRLIYADTVKKMKEQGNIVFIYNNDDPFATYYPQYFWRHYKKSLKYADVGFVYREKNIKEYQQYGCDKVKMLRAYYIKSRNYYMTEETIKVPAVVFLGHNENDERREYIRALLEEKIEVGIPMITWEKFESNNPYLVKFENSHKKYNEIMNAAQIAIVFLSKINNDTYTRRCFEIPATKTLMFAPYTDDIANLYEENKEVVFFRSKDEFVNKIKYYLHQKEECRKIAEEGYRRLMQDGHEVGDRIQYVMEIYGEQKMMEDI